MSKFDAEHRPPRATCATSRSEIESIAAGYGLDFFPTIFEILTTTR